MDKDFNYNGRGQQSLYIEVIANPYYGYDDLMRVYMNLELPEDILKEGRVVYHYMQLLAEGATEGDDDYISVGCSVTIGDEPKQKIDNFIGTSRLNATATEGQTVGEQNTDQMNEDIVFTAIKDEGYYGTYVSDSGATVSACAFDMAIPKDQSRNEDIFTVYHAYKGAKIYRDEEDTAPKQIGERNVKLDLGEADYSPDELIDEDYLEFLEPDEDEMYDEDYVEKEYEVQGSTEATIDAANVFGDENAVASQEFFSFYEKNSYIDLPDEISFTF